MANKTFEIADYQVVLGRGLTLGGGAAKFSGYLVLRGKNADERLVLYFTRPGDEPLPNATNIPKKWATSYLPAEEYPWYVDLLRNEKPVYATLNPDKPDWNRIHTGREPVGEAEEMMRISAKN
jgi:hypothetical protein